MKFLLLLLLASAVVLSSRHVLVDAKPSGLRAEVKDIITDETVDLGRAEAKPSGPRAEAEDDTSADGNDPERDLGTSYAACNNEFASCNKVCNGKKKNKYVCRQNCKRREDICNRGKFGHDCAGWGEQCTGNPSTGKVCCNGMICQSNWMTGYSRVCA